MKRMIDPSASGGTQLYKHTMTLDQARKLIWVDASDKLVGWDEGTQVFVKIIDAISAIYQHSMNDYKIVGANNTDPFELSVYYGTSSGFSSATLFYSQIVGESVEKI